jgi:HEAT repeat protein
MNTANPSTDMTASNSKTAPPETTPPGSEAAFDALKSYDAGSARGSLLAIDQAVTASLPDANKRGRLEARLLSLLQTSRSAVAREYICSKLALIGTKSSVEALAALLNDARISTAARNALEAIPGSAASKVLRKKLPLVTGLPKAGIINSIGVRRDAEAVSALAECLPDADHQVAAAAAAALAEIGTTRASRILQNHLIRTPESLRRNLADALLVCAARLSEQGRKSDADALLKLLLTSGQPRHIQEAAARARRGTLQKTVEK